MENNKNNITHKIYYFTRKGKKETHVGTHEGSIKQIDYENQVVWYNDGSFTHFEKVREEYIYLDLTDIRIYRDSARHEREKAEDERKQGKNK